MSDFLSDDRALLAAVLAAPKDDAPRLLFADCVRDRGMGELADFVQWQVANPTADGRRWNNAGGWEVRGPKTDAQNFVPIPDGMPEWFTDHSRAVVNGYKAGWTWTWRRGFVDELRMPAADAFDHLPRVLQVWPVRRATLVGEPGSEVERWLRERYPPDEYRYTKDRPRWLQRMALMVPKVRLKHELEDAVTEEDVEVMRRIRERARIQEADSPYRRALLARVELRALRAELEELQGGRSG